jgi:hypothetical protein
MTSIQDLPNDIIYLLLKTIDNPYSLVQTNKKINKQCKNIGYIKKLKISWYSDLINAINIQLKHYEMIEELSLIDIVIPERIIICNPHSIYFENCVFPNNTVKPFRKVKSNLKEITFKHFSHRKLNIDLGEFPSLEKINCCSMTVLSIINPSEIKVSHDLNSPFDSPF